MIGKLERFPNLSFKPLLIKGKLVQIFWTGNWQYCLYNSYALAHPPSSSPCGLREAGPDQDQSGPTKGRYSCSARRWGVQRAAGGCSLPFRQLWDWAEAGI